MTDTTSLANRLRKNLRHLSRWAQREGISCFRLYDRDIPEFPIILDKYADHYHLQEVETGYVQTDEEKQQWLEAIQLCLLEVLATNASHIHLKVRRRQKGESQYVRLAEMGSDFVVSEGGHQFWVNLDKYLDTGLFLDHRKTRRMVEQKAAGKRFLNLFAYTGSFTVYAACGGAVSSLTVDLSNTYQQWTRRNLQLNGIDETVHKLLCTDVFSYLDQASRQGPCFDLIVMDPPSFSNSKKMHGILDVQRDHGWLVDKAMQLLAVDGELIFSNNLRRFHLDEQVVQQYLVEELTARTIPEDFRQKQPHHCYLIRHRNPRAVRC